MKAFSRLTQKWFYKFWLDLQKYRAEHQSTVPDFVRPEEPHPMGKANDFPDRLAVWQILDFWQFDLSLNPHIRVRTC